MSSSTKKQSNTNQADDSFSTDEASTSSYRIKLVTDPLDSIDSKRESYLERSSTSNKPGNESSKKQITIDNYKSEMIQNFHKFRSENLFTDIFIYVEGVVFPCHKVVLCAASCYFKAMFSCDLKESRLGKVFIENISPWTMKRILDFIYTGKIEVNYENVIEIFNAAVMFQLNKLADKCSDYIHDHIDLANCVEIHVFSSMHQLEQIESDTFQFILDNFMQLINLQSICINKTTGAHQTNPNSDQQQVDQTQLFKKNARIPGASSTSSNLVYFGDFVYLNEQTFANLIKSDSLNVSREIYVYYALKKWIDYKVLVADSAYKSPNTVLKQTYENMFKNIRLNALTKNELEYILYNDELANSNEKIVKQIKAHLNGFACPESSNFSESDYKISFSNTKSKGEYQDLSNQAIKNTTSNEQIPSIINTLQELSLPSNSSNQAKIRPSTIPRDYLCLVKSNQFHYYDFYKSKWDILASWPPHYKSTSSLKKDKDDNECCRIFGDTDAKTNYEKGYRLGGYSTCLVNNILYIIGGYLLQSNNNTRNTSNTVSDQISLNDSQSLELIDSVWRFDPIRNEWSKCKNMLTKRAFHISINLKAKSAHKNTTNLHSKKGLSPESEPLFLDLIFVLYGLCYNSQSEYSNFPLRQCLYIDFYNLETDQWSRLKNTDSLLDHHMFQTIKIQNRLILNTANSNSSNNQASDRYDDDDDDDEENQNNEHEIENNILNLLNQLIKNQQSQAKLVISLRNLIYILKDNCIHCYEFDLNLEQLICLPYFRLPANLSTFWLAGAVSSSTQPTTTKSLFTWYTNKENATDHAQFNKDNTCLNQYEESGVDFCEVLIYLLNMEMGVLYQFYPAKNKLKKLPDLLMKHLSSETFLVHVNSKLYVTGAILADEVKGMPGTATAIEQWDGISETWTVFLNNIDSICFSTISSVYSMESYLSDSQLTLCDLIDTKNFLKLKMSLV